MEFDSYKAALKSELPLDSLIRFKIFACLQKSMESTSVNIDERHCLSQIADPRSSTTEIFSRMGVPWSEVHSHYARVTEWALSTGITDALRSASQYVLLVMLSTVQMLIALDSRLQSNKGVNYAVLVGASLVIGKNVSLAEDKASYLHDSLNETARVNGVRSLGTLSSLVALPIRLENLVARTVRNALADSVTALEREWQAANAYAAPGLCTLLLVVRGADALAAATSITLNVAGLLLVPLSAMLLLVDVFGVACIETIIVAFAENASFMPDLKGPWWATLSSALVLMAIGTHLLCNELALVAWVRNSLVFHGYFTGWRIAYKLIKTVPVDHEGALQAATNVAERQPMKPCSRAMRYRTFFTTGSNDTVFMSIIFRSQDHQEKTYTLVEDSTHLEEEPKRVSFGDKTIVQSYCASSIHSVDQIPSNLPRKDQVHFGRSAFTRIVERIIHQMRLQR